MHDFPYLQIFLLLSSVWIIGRVFQRFRWPSLFGELLAGIILGPVLLGVVEQNEAIKVLAEVGVFFLMLHAGLETSPSDLFKASKRAFWVAIGGVILPFAGAYYISVLFGYDTYEALFMGMGSSITSIAVSAKLFKDLKITKSCVANITMGAAIIADITGLVMFSVILNLTDPSSGGQIDLMLIGELILKILAFFTIVLLLGHKFSNLLHRVLYSGNKGFTFTIIIALAFGLFAEIIGLHIIIGAFLAGLFIREEVIDQKLFAKIEDRVFGVSYSFLGPIFFASLAFHLDFYAINKAPVFTFIFVIIAIFGKVIGAGIAALATKIGKLNSLGVGLAMNSRGAVELIIASIGLERGIISTEVFSILVFMAFITTLVSILGLKPLGARIRATIDTETSSPTKD